MDTGLIDWTIEIRELKTWLRFGMSDNLPQAVSVDIGIRARTPVRPQAIEDCVNYQPICRWALDDWPRHAHLPLLDGHAGALLDFIFAFDERIEFVELTLRPDTVIDAGGTLGYDGFATHPRNMHVVRTRPAHRLPHPG